MIIEFRRQQLDEQLNQLKNSIAKQLSDKTNQDNLLLSIEMNVQTGESSETFTVIFNSIERRLLFETKFIEYKQQLSDKELQTPLFLREIALPKTRAGLLFCCASKTLPFKSSVYNNLINSFQQQQQINQKLVNLDKTLTSNISNTSVQNSNLSSPMSNTSNLMGTNNSLNSTINQNTNQHSTISSCSSTSTTIDYEQDVWICNSDGYVGQVCVLSLISDLTVTSCNGVCNSRILCIVAVPSYRWVFNFTFLYWIFKKN